MMTLPSFLLGLFFPIFYGAIFHLLTGGGFFRLVLDIVLGWIGFWIGHFMADRFGFTFLSIGPLHWGMATIVSIIFIAVGYWLSLIPKKTEGTG